ncbi:MAG: ATPase, T2SS/T4P/T4SS family [Candidatus Cloacimonadaceae bacterium]|nr:ATPase, T2SS/T4P/T4SS family [Candidatus Cloacimonadaceae bacterium]MDP3113196.1 ATPase, T2SS/T4P/T4SS family [Candidatus Cloacimonadaceae bacterium]
MALSFCEEMRAHLSESINGVELTQGINAWLYDKPDQQIEARHLLHTWLTNMQAQNASDLDFGAPGSKAQVWVRVYGVKKPVGEYGQISSLESAAMILSWLSKNQKQILFRDMSVDFSLSTQIGDLEARFRGTAYYDRGYLCANFRRINEKLLTMESLGIPKPISDRMNLKTEKSGLILITGITGSGKSTTLDAIIDMNNRQNNAHIVIIAHPIEYVHESKLCLVRHREVGVDVRSFEHGAVEALRQDPDIIMVGEMRDPQTISTVLEITDSGHKAFTTLHTSSAIDSIHRIIAEFPAEEQERIRNRLADVLSVTMSQKLVPTVDNKLVMAKEILSVDSSVQAAIRNKNIGEIYQMMIEGKRYGMCTLEQDLQELFKRGIITNKTAMNYANNKKRMLQLLSI